MTSKDILVFTTFSKQFCLNSIVKRCLSAVSLLDVVDAMKRGSVCTNFQSIQS